MTFVIPLIIWAVGQTSKFLLNAVKRGKFTIADFTESGGMPSVHSAFVASLVTVVVLKEGISSALFGVSLIFSLIVIHDALKLRHVVEIHSKILNKLRSSLSPEDQKLNPQTIEHVGHQPLEVLAGILLGIFGTLILLWLLG